MRFIRVLIIAAVSAASVAAGCTPETASEQTEPFGATPATEANEATELGPAQFNLSPVADPLDRPGDRSIPLPASVVVPAEYDRQRDGLFEVYRSALRLEYVLVAERFVVASRCHRVGNGEMIDFNASTDSFVGACAQFREDQGGYKGLHFRNLPTTFSPPDIRFPVWDVHFSHDGAKVLLCKDAGGGNGFITYVGDLTSGALTELPKAAQPLCVATKVQWAEEWKIAYSNSNGSGLSWFDLKSLQSTVVKDGAWGMFEPPMPAPAPAFSLSRQKASEPEVLATLGVNGIKTLVFDGDYGYGTMRASPSGRWIASRRHEALELTHLKTLGDYGGPIPSISFKIRGEDAALLQQQGGEAIWELNVRKELRNPLVDNEIVGADPKTDLGVFRLIGCGSDLICDAIPVRPLEQATQALSLFSSDISGLAITELRRAEDPNAPAPFASDRFWIAETGRLR